jgi:hypothetical protein
MDENRKDQDTEQPKTGEVIDWKKDHPSRVGQPDRAVAFDRSKKGAGLREFLERVSDKDSEDGADGNIGGGASPGQNTTQKSRV